MKRVIALLKVNEKQFLRDYELPKGKVKRDKVAFKDMLEDLFDDTLSEEGVFLEGIKDLAHRSKWHGYITYLLKWAYAHSSEQYDGMSPACYDEWADNDGSIKF